MANKKTESIPINVSSRILRHISRGIYRSPAGALKELASNAYDAGAQKVTVNTDYPRIKKITVTDNGKGISDEKFRVILNQIGFSEKHIGDDVNVVGKKTKRKAIGHYGIGFLAIGQLTKKAIITSKVADSLEGIRAIMDFEQFETHTVQGEAKTTAINEAQLEKHDKRNQTKKPEYLNIGQCLLEIVKFDQNTISQSFTKVELIEIREDVKDLISGKNSTKLSAVVEQQKSYSAGFENILSLLREKEKQSAEIKIKDQKVPRLREYSYETLLWELSVYAPLSYPDMSVFAQDGELHHFATLANKSDFQLVVDGFVLSKPYEKWFWQEKQGFGYKVYKWENEKYFNDNVASAYLIYQPGTMIRPKAIQGILVRENQVAVGLYDTTFLNYPFNEGTKFNSLTGEIYANGLSGGMNVDRDSFNQTDEAYVALRDWFHAKLYFEVFPDIKSLQKAKESPSRKKSTDLVIDVLSQIANPGKKITKVIFKALGKTEKKRVKLSKSTLIINSDHKDCDMSVAKREKLILATTLIIDGYITEEIYDAVSEEIERSKSKIRKHA